MFRKLLVFLTFSSCILQASVPECMKNDDKSVQKSKICKYTKGTFKLILGCVALRQFKQINALGTLVAQENKNTDTANAVLNSFLSQSQIEDVLFVQAALCAGLGICFIFNGGRDLYRAWNEKSVVV